MSVQTIAPDRPPMQNRAGQWEYTPRQAEKAEMAVIGTIIQSAKAFDEVAAVIGPEHFYRPLHGRIFEIVQTLQRDGRPINPMELAGALDGALMSQTRNGAYLHECIAEVPTLANGSYFARQVLAAAQLREAAEHAVKTMQITAATSLNDVAGAMEMIRASAENLGKGGGIRPSWMDWDQLAQAALDELERLGQVTEGDALAGVPTGWSDYDRLTGTHKPGQVVVIAGRPGSGKTVAGLNIAQHAAERLRIPVVFFSLEMSALECSMRLISAGSRVPLHALKQGPGVGPLTDDDWMRIARYVGDSSGAPLFVDDTPNITLAHADAQMYRLTSMLAKRDDLVDQDDPDAERPRPKIVVFDYLQLIKPSGGKAWSRQEEVAQVSRDLKLFAKKWGVTVILLAQLNRGPEQRTEKIPQLSDLRESGAVEQDADIVILLYRPDYYDKESPRAGEVDFIVAKNRHGPTDTITMAAQLHLSRFVDMAIL